MTWLSSASEDIFLQHKGIISAQTNKKTYLFFVQDYALETDLCVLESLRFLNTLHANQQSWQGIWDKLKSVKMFVLGLLICHFIKFWCFFMQESIHWDLVVGLSKLSLFVNLIWRFWLPENLFETSGHLSTLQPNSLQRSYWCCRCKQKKALKVM